MNTFGGKSMELNAVLFKKSAKNRKCRHYGGFLGWLLIFFNNLLIFLKNFLIWGSLLAYECHLSFLRVCTRAQTREKWHHSASSGSSASVFQGPQYLTTLPSNMLKNGAGWAPKSLPGASGGLWGRSGHRLMFLRRKKKPAGALKTRIGFFFGKKTPREGAYRTHI